jgi:hypothetical protein
MSYSMDVFFLYPVIPDAALLVSFEERVVKVSAIIRLLSIY